MKSRALKNRYFTLIELLVVVAIIGILSSILLPSLVKARKSVKRAVCGSNLKQVGMTSQMYLDDSNDWYPPKDGLHRHTWIGKKGTTYQRHPKDRILNQYIHDGELTEDVELKVMKCPDDKEQYDLAGSTYTPNYNQLIQGLFIDHGQGSRNFSEIKSPSKFVVFNEEGALISAQGNAINDFLFNHADVGIRRWNVVFTDMHVLYVNVSSSQKTGSDFTFNRAD